MCKVTWQMLMISTTCLLISGCAALEPEGAKLAQMDFKQFTESAIAQDNPEMAKRFSASRAAVCERTMDGETAPCLSRTGTLFQSVAVSKDPERRLEDAFNNWCAAHGGRATASLPSRPGSKPNPSVTYSDFGTAVSNLKIKGGPENSTSQSRIPMGRQCTLGQASVGLITSVLFSGMDETRKYRKAVLALFYDENDLIAFTKSMGSTNRAGTGSEK